MEDILAFAIWILQLYTIYMLHGHAAVLQGAGLLKGDSGECILHVSKMYRRVSHVFYMKKK